jgi:gliding motility-associated lipoprotein GldH
MTGEEWKLQEPVTFRMPLRDTALRTNVYFTLRTGSEYPFRNIWLFVNTLAPDGKSLTDTIEYFLADEKGKRAGSGFGDIKELVLPYRTNVYFPSAGVWQFRIHHGMRTDPLKGIYDLSLTIEKNQLKKP